MMLLIFIAAVGVSIALERQERRHLLEQMLEHRRLRWETSLPVPRLSRMEGWITVAFGVILFGSGGWLGWVIIRIPHPESATSTFELVELMIAAGAALTILGGNALMTRARRG
jgi:hypothetical protein